MGRVLRAVALVVAWVLASTVAYRCARGPAPPSTSPRSTLARPSAPSRPKAPRPEPPPLDLAIERGDIRIRLTGARVIDPPEGLLSRWTGPLLELRFAVENRSRTSRYYLAGTIAPRPTLRDSRAHLYHEPDELLDRPVGLVEPGRGAIDPGGSLAGRLIYDPPPDDDRILKLSIPSVLISASPREFGPEGEPYTFDIPAASIRWP